MFALPNVLHFFAHEFARLGGRRKPFTFIFVRPFDCFVFWHNANVSPWNPLLDVRNGEADVLNSQIVESTTAILLRKRKFSDTSLIVSWCTESLGCIQTVRKRGVPCEKSICRQVGFVLRGGNSDRPEPQVRFAHLDGSRAQKIRSAAFAKVICVTQTAAYFVELIEICTERDHREPELFALLQPGVRLSRRKRSESARSYPLRD